MSFGSAKTSGSVSEGSGSSWGFSTLELIYESVADINSKTLMQDVYVDDNDPRTVDSYMTMDISEGPEGSIFHVYVDLATARAEAYIGDAVMIMCYAGWASSTHPHVSASIAVIYKGNSTQYDIVPFNGEGTLWSVLQINITEAGTVTVTYP